MDKLIWIIALRDAANKYRIAAPGTLFNPNYCPLCAVAFSINEDWDNRCRSCIFFKDKCNKQDSFIKANEAYNEADSFELDIHTINLLTIRANELDTLADNIESIPNEFFSEWVEQLNIAEDGF